MFCFLRVVISGRNRQVPVGGGAVFSDTVNNFLLNLDIRKAFAPWGKSSILEGRIVGVGVCRVRAEYCCLKRLGEGERG